MVPGIARIEIVDAQPVEGGKNRLHAPHEVVVILHAGLRPGRLGERAQAREGHEVDPLRRMHQLAPDVGLDAEDVRTPLGGHTPPFEPCIGEGIDILQRAEVVPDAAPLMVGMLHEIEIERLARAEDRRITAV